MLRKKLIFILTPIVFAGLMAFSLRCSIDKGKLTPKETDGFTSQDMDKGQNNLFGIYPHVIDIEVEATGAGTQPPWVFYIRFDLPMDTSLTPDVRLEEITNHNQTSGINAIDPASVRWTEGKNNELTFRTGSNFKVICTPPNTLCDNYLLTITSANTRSTLGIQMDGNWNNGSVGDDFINAPSDFVNRLRGANSIDSLPLYPSAVIPAPLPATYVYDLALATVRSNDENDYLDMALSDADESGYINISFNAVMEKSDITPSNIVVVGPDGKTINGNFWVDTDNNGTPDKPVDDPSTPQTTPGQTNTYYKEFWFRPQQLPMALGRYTLIVHCSNIHKVDLTDVANGEFQRKVNTCNDVDPANDDDDEIDNDNDEIFEFYVTSDGNQPNLANRVWGVYTTNDPGPFGANEIKLNQAFVLFQTPDPKDNLMDNTTLIPQNLSLLKGGSPVTVQTSIEERYFRCAKSTVWVLNGPPDENLNGANLTISYAVKDKAGNTLDSNGDLLYELNANDNFNDPSLPYDVISNNTPPANYVQTDPTRVYNQTYNPKGFAINQNQVFIVFDTPAESDDRMNLGSLSADDLQLSGAGTGSCTCTCLDGDCAGEVTLNTAEDTTNYSVPTTVWQITFNNPPGCNVKNCNLRIFGGSVTAAGTRPTDICGNWLYPDYTQNNLP